MSDLDLQALEELERAVKELDRLAMAVYHEKRRYLPWGMASAECRHECRSEVQRRRREVLWRELEATEALRAPGTPPRAGTSRDGVTYWQEKYQGAAALGWEAEAKRDKWKAKHDEVFEINDELYGQLGELEAERDEWKQKYETLLQQRYEKVYDVGEEA